MRRWLTTVLFLLSFMVVFSGRLDAQETDSLSRNSEIFYKQISDILLNTPSKLNQAKSQGLLFRLDTEWSQGRFNKDEKDAIRHIIEIMRGRKLKTYPYLYKYIHALTLLAESLQPPKAIVGWHRYAETRLNGRKSDKFLAFADFTIDLLEQEILYGKKSVAWYARNARFRFELDTNFLIRYKHLSLVCASRRDSSVIIKTKGVYNYDQKTWTGEEGTVQWTRFGEEYEDTIYADLQKYNILLINAYYTVDSAVLHYDRFFKHPVLGQFSEKVMSSSPNTKTSYPRFESYLKDFELRNIYPGITYHGGFYINGLKLFGIGGEESDAYVSLYYNNEVIGRAEAEIFRLGDEKLESNKTEIVFYFEGDSLYHPNLRMRYMVKNKQLELFSTEEGVNMIPFFDSYHELDIYAPALFWNLDSVNLYFKRIKGVHSQDVATFVSSNYFSERDFYEIQGMDELNPMYVIQNYLKSYNDRVIKLNALAAFMKKSPEQVSAMLIELSNNGFLVYNSREETAIVKDRFLDFLNAKSGRSDYDVIKLESKVAGKPNASINLRSLSLDVFGVPEVSISDSQEVYIYPYNNTISFRKNRDFTFDGQVHMGLFDFYTRDNLFVYDTFMIRLNYIDSLVFKVLSTDSLERIDSVIKVKNIIADLNGKIYIDMPFNKSGIKNFEQYPIFVSDEESYVYFNDTDIQDSTLYPENFYFKIEPFIFDSLSTFSTDGISFPGTLTSSGIFPPITESMVVMEDYSLGFDHITPDDGYPIYGGKGTFTSKIHLSNKGFYGDGTLRYLTSGSASDHYIFYPDSLLAVANNFNVLESPQEFNFPYAHSDSVDIRWLTDTNVMFVVDVIDTFNIYPDARLLGSLRLSPDNMRGGGSFFFDKSEIQSKDFNFMYTELTADSADFFLRKDVDTLVFKSNGYFARIDFEQQKGWFDNLTENAFVEFPYNKYISNLDEVEWEMSEDKIMLRSDLENNYKALDTLNDVQLIDYHLSGPEFISIESSPDSVIRFFAGQATYDLNSFTIDVENVKLIKAGDAAIFPSEGYVKLLRDGGIYTLFNATIIADTLNKYHRIYDAEVDIYSRHWYYANGYIDYVDRNKTAQPVYLMRLEMSPEGQTTGFGELEPTDIFFLSPEYFFTGSIGINANQEFLRFTGGYRINEDCVGQEDKWVSFDKYLNPDQISFDINENSRDMNNKRVRFGLAYSSDIHKYYPLVLESTLKPSDDVLIESRGQIDFDTATNSYRVGSAVFGANNDEQSFVSLSIDRCVISGDGILDPGVDLNMVRMIAAGEFKHLVIPDSTYLHTALLLDFHFDKQALEMITDSLRIVNSYRNLSGEGQYPTFLKKVIGTEKSQEIINEISLYGRMQKIPKELEHTFILSDVKFKWDTESRSFIAKGPIGIGYIAGVPVNKYVDGYIQIQKSRASSGLNMYFKLNNDQWYFFSYKRGIMQVMSSDNRFNDYISGIKPDKRTLNPGSDENYYEYVISTRRKIVDFLREMEKIDRRL